jgi:hypothetical protein
MAGRERVDFSQVLTDIEAPKTANGERLVAAAHAEGEGIVAGAKAEAGLLSFLGTGAAEAVKGKLLADEERALLGTVDKLEPMVDKRIAENNRKLAGQFVESSTSDDFMGSQTVAHFQREAERFANAQKQGVLSREEALTRIGDIIKHYSSLAPGWASDFRKLGAEITGISNADAYGVHKALTTQSRQEKLIEAQQKAQVELDQDIAKTYGIAITEITPHIRNSYAQFKQGGVVVQQLEQRKKQGEMVQAEVDEVNGKLASAYIARGVAGIAADFAKLYSAHLGSDTPVKQELAQQMGGALAGKLDVLDGQLVEAINNLTVGKNAMSRAAADQVLTGVRAQIKEWREAVKTADGFNLWAKTIKNANGNVQYIVDRTQLAAPHLAVLNKLGVLPDMAKAWIAIGDPKKFEEQFGRSASEALRVAMTNSQGYAQGFGLIATGQSSVRAESERDPILGKVLYNDVVNGIKSMLDDPSSVLRNKEVFSNFLANYADNIKHSNPAELKKFQELMFDPNMMKALDQLNPEQRKKALGMVFAKIDTTVPQEQKNIRDVVQKFNEHPVAQQRGFTMSVFFNPVTEQIEVEAIGGNDKPNLSGMGPDGKLKTDRGSVVKRGLQSPFSFFPAAGQDPELRSLIEDARRSAAWLNTSAYVVSNTLGKVNSSVGNVAVGDVLRNMKTGIDTGVSGPLLGGLVRRSVEGGTPREQSQRADIPDERIVQAIIAAERSNIDAGLSPAGALGPMQFMPETAKEMGLVVDPERGIDERTDISKAGPAAVKYVRKHLADFDGDLAKTAAAYNAGAGNVRAAIEKAKRAGSPDDWVYFLPKPAETGPYIQRFQKALQ